MKGTISTSQKCHECGGVFKYIEGAGIMQCPKHSQNIWHLNCFVRFGRAHTKRFKTVREAERHLTYLRAQTDHGVFDVRDWQKAAPLSFYSLRKKYIPYKKKQGDAGKSQLKHIDYVLGLAGIDWDNMNIKEIGEGEIEDFFIKDHGVSNKTLSNYKTVLTGFWKWVVRREKKNSKLEMPEFPDISFTLGWRKIVSMKSQGKILDEVKRLTFKENPRIWLGIKLLSMYPRIRPAEMLDIRESDFNLDENWIFIRDPKERNFKFVHILPEHSELIRKIRGPEGMPELFFYRHLQARSGVKAGVRFGRKQFRMWWNRACENLGIQGVELYGGTKHSTVTALGKMLTPEQIKRGATGHVSDAFERYMLPDINEAQIATQAVVEMQSQEQKEAPKTRTGSDPHVIHLPETKKAAK